MKFSIISFWEKWYKFIFFSVLLLFTILSIFVFTNLSDDNKNNYSFFISTVYALLLFGIGQSITYYDSKFDKLFTTRKDYYFNLLELNGIFNSINLSTASDYDIYNSINIFRIFTGRSNNITPFICEKGFKFISNELEIEDIFIKKREVLLEELNNYILDYIDRNSIKLNHPNIHINKLYFDIKKWCNYNCNLNNNELNKMEEYIYVFFSNTRNQLDDINDLMKKISKQYSFYKSQTELNIKMLEDKYGERLEHQYYKDNKYIYEQQAFNDVINKIDNISSILNNVSDTNTDIIINSINDVEINLENHLDNIENIISCNEVDDSYC